MTATYTYLCSDGTWRTRCKAHADAAKGTKYGPSPHFPRDQIKRSKAQCVECTWTVQPATSAESEGQ